MRYIIAVLAIACFAIDANAGCRGKLFSRIRANRPVATAVVKVATAPVQAVRTIVCNGKTCVVK